MTQLKKLKQNSTITSKDGWNFGVGFWGATLAFWLIIGPILFCLAALIISTIGYNL